MENCPGGELPKWVIILVGSHPGEELSVWELNFYYFFFA